MSKFSDKQYQRAKPLLAKIIASELTARQVADKVGLTEDTINRYVRRRLEELAAKDRADRKRSVGSLFWVSLDRKSWQIAESDGEGGFRGFTWSVKNGDLYEYRRAEKPPQEPDRAFKKAGEILESLH